MRFTLKIKLTLAACATVLASIGAVYLVQRGQLEEDARRLFASEQESLAFSLARDLNDKLDLHVDMLTQAAALVDAEDLSTPAAREAFLHRVTGLKTWFDGIAIVGLSGEVLLNDPPYPPGTRIHIGDRPYFKDALASQRPTISAPLRSRSTGGPTVLMVAPIRDAAKRPTGFLAVGLDLLRPNVLGRMNQHPVGQTGHIEITTRGQDRVYVVHPDAGMILAPARDTAASSDWLVSRVALSTVPWELQVMLPAWEARAPALEAQRRMARVLLIVGGAAALLAWLGAAWLLRPLHRLSDTIRLLRRAPDAPVRLDTSGQDERGDLAREFQSLIDELQERQQELAAVSAASPLGLFRTDTEGDITWVNEAFLQMHGLAHGEMARGWLLLLPPERREATWDAWREVIGRAEPSRVQMRMQLRGGGERHFEIRTAPLLHHGQLAGHAGTVTDVSERVEGGRAQRMLAAVLDATSDFVVQTDASGQVQYMNPAARRVLAMAEDQPVEQHHFSEFNTSETNALFGQVIVPALRDQGVWLGETTVRVAQGRVLPVSHMVIAHRDRNGRVERYSAIMRDISAQRDAQQEAQRQGSTMQAVAEAIPAIVAVVGKDERYRFVNQAFERWRGVSRDKLLGRSLLDVLGDEDYARSHGWATRALAGESVQFERGYHADKGGRHLSITYIPLRLGDGGVDGFVGVALDITSHRQREADLTEMAQRDALTGLFNRVGFGGWLQARVAAGEGLEIALLYIDLDHFKPVNDRYGHPVGDRLLRQFAVRLRETVRPTDAVARLGGDEFAVALAGVREPAHARLVADKVLAAAHRPFEVDGLALGIGASVGVAVGVQPGDSVDDLVRRADEQLYAAKAQGRGRAVG